MMFKTTINFFAFQAGWLGCVLGAANGMPWVGPVIIAMVAGLHLNIVPQPGRELMTLLAALAIGTLADSLLMATGWVSYREGLWIPGLAPVWLLAMWVGFATTLNGCMRWLRERPWLAAAFGFLGGPAAYYAGARLGAMNFENLPAGLLALALIWALVMPLLYALARRFDGTLTGGSNSRTTWVTG